MYPNTLVNETIDQIRSLISPREREVLELLSNGNSSVEIATHLYLSNHTVNDHRRSLMMKLQARNVAQMIRRGFELNLLNPSIYFHEKIDDLITRCIYSFQYSIYQRTGHQR